jgi:hypothetical protein
VRAPTSDRSADGRSSRRSHPARPHPAARPRSCASPADLFDRTRAPRTARLRGGDRALCVLDDRGARRRVARAHRSLPGGGPIRRCASVLAARSRLATRARSPTLDAGCGAASRSRPLLDSASGLGFARIAARLSGRAGRDARSARPARRASRARSSVRADEAVARTYRAAYELAPVGAATSIRTRTSVRHRSGRAGSE